MDLADSAVWYEDNSEKLLEKDFQYLESLKKQNAEDLSWFLRNLHDNLNLKGWATVLGIDMTDMGCDTIMKVQKMPQDVREGFLRSIRFSELQYRIRALEQYKFRRQDAITKWLRTVLRLLWPRTKRGPAPPLWWFECTMALPAGHEGYVAMNTSASRSASSTARLERHDSVASMQDVSLA